MAVQRSKTPFIVVLVIAFVVALGMGMLIAWPLFSSPGVPGSSGDVACTYLDALEEDIDAGNDELVSQDSPKLWQMMTMSQFVAVADLEDGTEPGDEIGRSMQTALAKQDIDLIRDEALPEIEEFCDARKN